MDQKVPTPQKFDIENLRSQYSLLNFIVNDQIKTIDSEKELSIKAGELTGRLGISDRAVSKWKTGKSMPDSGIMLVLCELLNISVNELL